MKNSLKETFDAFAANGVLDQAEQLSHLAAEIMNAQDDIAELEQAPGDNTAALAEANARLNTAKKQHQELYQQMLARSEQIHGPAGT